MSRPRQRRPEPRDTAGVSPRHDWAEPMHALARSLLRSPAGRGALVALSSLAMTACLLPQDDHLLPEIPAPRNRPPRILESTVLPARFQTVGHGANCKLDFSLGVEDQDTDDVIAVRWYVDYSSSNPTQQPVHESVLYSSGKPTRNTPAEYTSYVSSPEDPLHAIGLHVVEAVVADGQLVGHDTVLDRATGADGGTNPSYIVTYGWTVDVSPEDCP